MSFKLKIKILEYNILKWKIKLNVKFVIHLY